MPSISFRVVHTRALHLFFFLRHVGLLRYTFISLVRTQKKKILKKKTTKCRCLLILKKMPPVFSFCSMCRIHFFFFSYIYIYIQIVDHVQLMRVCVCLFNVTWWAWAACCSWAWRSFIYFLCEKKKTKNRICCFCLLKKSYKKKVNKLNIWRLLFVLNWSCFFCWWWRAIPEHFHFSIQHWGDTLAGLFFCCCCWYHGSRRSYMAT